MKVLFIGGTGNISISVSKLCVERGIDLYLLNRGIRKVEIPGTKTILGDISKPGQLQAIGHAFHITSDEILTWSQIYQTVAAAAGTEANIIHISSDFIVQHEPSLTGNLLGDKAQSAIFDNSKIKTFVPDFIATIPFSEGFKRTLAWFDAEPKRQIINKETNEMMDKIILLYEEKLQ